MSVSFADYQKVAAVNWSTLREIGRSPLHYRHLVENPRADSVRFALGRAAHTAVLEPKRFLRDYALYEGAVRRGKEFEAFKAQHPNKTILKGAEYDQCLAIADAVHAHPAAAELLKKGEPEQVMTWTDPVTGIECKARPDWMCDAGTVDLKTARNIDPRRFAAQVASLSYNGQASFYQQGRMLARGESAKPFFIIAVELEAPHDVSVYELDSNALYAGECLVGEYLAKVKECRATGVWPGRCASLETLSLPSWAEPDYDDATDLDLNWKSSATNNEEATP